MFRMIKQTVKKQVYSVRIVSLVDQLCKKLNLQIEYCNSATENYNGALRVCCVFVLDVR